MIERRTAPERPRWQQRFVGAVWATHNQSADVRRALADVLASADARALGLNVGSGNTRLGPTFIAVDLARTSATDVVADARALPFAAGPFGVVVSQEMV